MTLNLSFFEIALLFCCAVMLGIVIHFFLVSRKNLKGSFPQTKKTSSKPNEWKVKYFNDIESKEKELMDVKDKLSESEENVRIYHVEVDELRKQQKNLLSEIESLKRNSTPQETRPDYIQQLRQAQAGLMDNNEKITQLLEKIEMLQVNEEKARLLQSENEQLLDHVKELKYQLSQKETEIQNIRKKENINREMSSMLDHAYSDFNVLQSKIQKLETQVSSNQHVSLEYEDLKEAYYKTNTECEEQRARIHGLTIENQQSTLHLQELEDKLREANFQRQQLQKRVSYLEELNSDLQMIADGSKKLEHQLRRMGELESMLNVISEERDELLKRQTSE